MTTRQQKKREDILPCPFCGQKPEFLYVSEELVVPELKAGFWSLSCRQKRIICGGCPMSFGETKSDAVANWNRRAPKPKRPKAKFHYL